MTNSILQSCRELKSYISEGRQIIQSIEEETLADNPPLFREYVTARPDIRLLMDNQFRNVKTHARLLSKAMWYEWRMKLLEGLQEGLNRHVEEMKADDNLLSQQEDILKNVVPKLADKRSTLESEAMKLQKMVDEMESCDPEELRIARERLAKVDADMAKKRAQLEQMQADLKDKTDTIEAGTELKTEFMAQIRKAEQIREECRGWSIKEVNALRGKLKFPSTMRTLLRDASNSDVLRFCEGVGNANRVVCCGGLDRRPSDRAWIDFEIQGRTGSQVLSHTVPVRCRSK